MVNKINQKRIVYWKLLILSFIIIFIVLFISNIVLKIQDINSMIEISDNSNKTLPDDFEDNFFNISNLNIKDVKLSSDSKVIGFSLPYDSFRSFNEIKGKLESNNWINIESGQKNITSFSKNGAKYSWIFLNIQDFNNSSSVVMIVD